MYGSLSKKIHIEPYTSLFSLLFVCLFILPSSILAQDQKLIFPSPYEQQSIHPVSKWFFSPVVKNKKFSSQDWESSIKEEDMTLESQSGKVLKKGLKKAAQKSLALALDSRNGLNDKARKTLFRYARKFLVKSLRLSRKNRVKTNLSIQVAFIDFQTKGKSKHINKLEKWSKKASKKWQIRATLLRGLLLLQKGGEHRDKGLDIITDITTDDNIQQSIIDSATGTILAGSDLTGKKRRPSSAKWSSFIKRSLSLSSGKGVYAESILAWAHISLTNSYDKPPQSGVNWTLPVNKFRRLEVLSSILERKALYQLSARQLESSLQTYQIIYKLQKANKRPLDGIESKIARIALLEYETTQNLHLLNKRFKTFVERNQIIKDRAPSDSQNVAQTYLKKYKLIAQDKLNKNLQEISKSSQALEDWYKFSESILDSRSRASFAIILSEFYGRSNQIQKSVSILKPFLPNASIEVFDKTIYWQSKLASWPLKIEFRTRTAIQKRQREELFRLYSLKANKSPTWDWQSQSQMGLLLLNMGKDLEYSKGWLDALEKSYEANQYSAQQAGFLALTLYQKKMWPDFVRLGHLIKTNKIPAQISGKPIKWTIGFADALYLHGLDQLKNENYNSSTSLFTEFLNDYRKDRRREEVYYKLAISQQFEENHDLAIETILKLINEFPKGRYRYQALLFGGNLAYLKKKGEKFSLLYEQFNKSYPNDLKSVIMRRRLVEYYVSKAYYGEALDILKQQSTNPKVPPKEQVESAMRFMRIEEQHGERAPANVAAELIIKHASSTETQKAIAYGLQARIAADEANFDQLRGINDILSQWNLSNPEVQNTLSFVRFFLAENNSDFSYEEASVISISKPLQAIQGYAESSETKIVLYEDICINGAGTFCAPALLRKWQIVNIALNKMKDIKIPDSLPEEDVKTFEKQKSEIMAPLKERSRKWLESAIELVNDGKALRDWKSLILEVERGETPPETLPESVSYSPDFK